MIGVRLGPWIIDAEIGRGGMGTVWKAHRAADAPDPDDGDAPALAAVKVLAPELAVESGEHIDAPDVNPLIFRLDSAVGALAAPRRTSPAVS